MSKPYVSFIVMSYMAEQFIEEAIEGAFSQTYDNMEIIFSDDASSDKTFEIIQGAVANYSGRHKIRVYRNESNIGIGAHLNKLWYEIAEGEWIVVSAGDDVSLPNRVDVLMKNVGPDVSVIHHGLEFINEHSEIIDLTPTYSNVLDEPGKESIEDIIRKNYFLVGSSMCLNRKMLQKFGPFNSDIVNEDNILAYRAHFYGRIIFLHEKLIRYRRHEESVSHMPDILIYANYVKHISKNSKNMLAIYNQILSDNKVLNLSPAFLLEINSKIVDSEMDWFLYGGGSFSLKYLKSSKFYQKFFKRIVLRGFLAIKRISR